MTGFLLKNLVELTHINVTTSIQTNCVNFVFQVFR